MPDPIEPLAHDTIPQAFIQNLPVVSEEEVERYLVRVVKEEEEEDQMR